jgi:hypothetical protein
MVRRAALKGRNKPAQGTRPGFIRRLHRQWHPERLGSVGNVGLRHPKFHRLLHPQRLEQHHRQQFLHDGLVLLQPADGDDGHDDDLIQHEYRLHRVRLEG